MSTVRLVSTTPFANQDVATANMAYLTVAGGIGLDANAVNRRHRFRTAGTLSSLAVNKVAGDRTGMVAVAQINGADATLTVAFTATNGIYEDTTHSDAVAVGDLVGWRFYGGSSGLGPDLAVSVVACNFTTPGTAATNVLAIGTVLVTNPSTSGDYRPLNGYARDAYPASSQANAQWLVKLPSGSGPLTIKNLYVRVSNNDCTAGVIITVNGASGTGTAPSITVPAGAGANSYEDTTSQITALDGDLLCLKFVVDPVSSGPSPYAGYIEMPVISVEIDGPDGLFHFVHCISDGNATATNNQHIAIGGGREWGAEGDNWIPAGLALNARFLALNVAVADATSLTRLRRTRTPLNTSLMISATSTGWLTSEATEALGPTDQITVREGGLTSGVGIYVAAVTVTPEPVPSGIRESLRYIRSPGQSPGPPALSHLRSKRQFLLDRTIPEESSLTPGTGTLTLTGQPPAVATATRITPLVGALALTGAAPALGTSLTPGTGTLTLTGIVPSRSTGTLIQPATGALALTGAAPSSATSTVLTPGTGSLTLTGNAPSRSTDTRLTPIVGALTLTGYAPTVGTEASLTPATGALTLTGAQPARVTGAIITPGAGSLTLTGDTPTEVTGTLLQSATGALALTGAAPILVSGITPLVGALTLVGQTPSLIVSTFLSPAAGALVLSASAPELAQPNGLTPGTGDLTLTGYAPALFLQVFLTPGTGALILTAAAPTVLTATFRTPAAGSLTLTGQTPSPVQGSLVTVGQGSLTLTGNAPTRSTSTLIQPATGALTLTGAQPDLITAIFLTPAVGSLTLAGTAPSLMFGTGLTPTNAILTLTGYAPTLRVETFLSPATGALVLSGSAPILGQLNTFTLGTGSLTLTGSAPTLLLQIFLAPSTGALTLAGQIPTLLVSLQLQPGSGALTLAGQAPTASQDVSLTPGTGSLTITGQPPSIGQPGVFLTPGTGTCSLTGYQPEILVVTLSPALTPGTGALTLTGYAPTVVAEGVEPPPTPTAPGGLPVVFLPFLRPEQPETRRQRVLLDVRVRVAHVGHVLARADVDTRVEAEILVAPQVRLTVSARVGLRTQALVAAGHPAVAFVHSTVEAVTPLQKALVVWQGLDPVARQILMEEEAIVSGRWP